MRAQPAEGCTRRRVLGGLTVVGAAGLLERPARPVAAERPPETTRLRFTQTPAACAAPRYVAEEWLGEEGFTEVQYGKTTGGGGTAKALAAGMADISTLPFGPLLIRVDFGDPIRFLAGVHLGCFERSGTERVRTIRDLKGKTVAVFELASGAPVFLASVGAYVGLDPRRDMVWIERSSTEAMRLLAAGTIDAYLGFPPEPQELRAEQIGPVVVNSMLDRPWSQDFGCLVAGNRAFIEQHAVATKRALRAVLRAANVGAREPERGARFLVDKGDTKHYDYALHTIREIPYGNWREDDPDNTIRFYALRLHAAGMIKSSPPKLMARGTEWRFLNELKQELKG
jgi:NitT/TauT family transport system substrate-binding protein